MKINFTLTKDDLLTFQLFEASKSPIIKRRRTRNWFLIPVIYAASGGYLYYTKKDARIFMAFGIAALAWMLFYPAYSRWLYRKQFERYINKNFDTATERTYSLELSAQTMNYFDGEAEGKFQYENITSISEIPDHFLVGTSENKTIIIPKSDKPENNREFILELAARCNSEVSVSTDWKWR